METILADGIHFGRSLYIVKRLPLQLKVDAKRILVELITIKAFEELALRKGSFIKCPWALLRI
jgi:hypothetical protein